MNRSGLIAGVLIMLLTAVACQGKHGATAPERREVTEPPDRETPRPDAPSPEPSTADDRDNADEYPDVGIGRDMSQARAEDAADSPQPEELENLADDFEDVQEEEEQEQAPAAAPGDAGAVADLDEVDELATAERSEAKRKSRQQERPARPRFSPSGASASSSGRGSVDLESLSAARDAYERGDGAIDLDADGRADWYPSTGPDGDGRAEVEYLDVDADGRPDLTVTEDDGVRREALDLDHDGRVEQLVTTTAGPDGGAIREQLDDLDRDGIFDQRIRTTIDVAAGLTLRQEWVAEGEGWTLVSERTLPLDQPSLARVTTEGAGACSPAEARRARQALDAAIAKGHDCLSRTDPTLSMQVLRRLVTSQVEIQCGWDLSELSACAVSPGASLAQAWTGRGPVDIRLSSLAFSRSSGCDDLEALLFHELLHYVVGVHPSVDGRADPGDRVFACQETCFGVATSQTCAACRGSRNGDAQCQAYPALACEGEAPSLCTADGALHASVESCSTRCEGSCIHRGPCRP